MLPPIDGGESPITKPLAPVVGANSPNTGLPALVVGAKFPTTKLRTPVIKAVSSTARLVTLQLDGRGEVTICFWKIFYQIFKDKTFYNFFYKGFYCKRKIFYKFDYILPANKHLKIEKPFFQKKKKIFKIFFFQNK